MKQVAKLVIIDEAGTYLLMYRSDHPMFGDDPDLPGGTVEKDESLLDAMVREVFEESDIIVDPTTCKELYSGMDYSDHGTNYGLFVANVAQRPAITMSWEHSSYEWISRDDFLSKAKNAKDSYMHMVYNVMRATPYTEQ